jgi:hypothetical protein
LDFYFLKLSKISSAIFFHHKPNASQAARASIEINQIRIVFVIIVAIQIFDKTSIRVKKSIIICAQVAIIFAVFCFVKFSVW